MHKTFSARIDVALLCVLAIAMQAPLPAQLANSPQAGRFGKPVTIECDALDIRAAVKLLFQAAGQSYTIAPDVKGTVTLSLKEVPFRTALGRLLAASGQPLKFTDIGGAYNIERDIEAIQNAKQEAEMNPKKTIKIRINYADAAQLVRRFDSDIKAMASPGISVAVAPDNSIVARYTNEDSLRELKELIRLMDEAPREIEVQAELIIAFDGKAGDHPVTLVHATGRTANNKPIVLKLVDEGVSATVGTVKFAGGASTVRVVPIVDGDHSIHLDAEWSLDLTIKPFSGGAPMRIRRTYTGSMRAGGSAVKLTSSAIKLADAVGSQLEGQIILFVTPRILPDPVVLRPTGAVGVVYDRSLNTVVLNLHDSIGGQAGKVVTDALSHELAASQHFEVVPAESVRKASASLELKAPYDAAALDRLTYAVGANLAINAETKRSPDGRSLTISVRTHDSTGIPRFAMSTVALGDLSSAARAAAYSVVRDLLGYQTLEGTILTTSDGLHRKVLLNRGEKDGLRAGTELAVYRGSERMGLVRVIRLFANDSIARIVDGALSVRPEDTVQTYIRGVSGSPGSINP